MHKRFLVGFTVVELLVIIAIISILATVGVVSYRGVQSRGNDTAVQSDLVKFAEALNVYYSDNRAYPVDSAALATVTAVKFSKSNYLSTGNAVLYCVTASGAQNAAVIGKSLSGRSYYTVNDTRVRQFTTGTFPNGTPTVNCTDAGVAAATAIWIHSTAGGWISSV